ncbi:MAG: phage tail protein [Clostridium sp.]|uniref:phage tail spike protein n=1 Tax=Clostridium sp. TaxID=1506 RepID=UPI0025B924DF|nr:phage tail spike protein [Clostridium sp.]MCH3962696.1 phage tail protein [Clostridium sp.]MCI2201081.1 phage tail protein [Clostridium sp.]
MYKICVYNGGQETVIHYPVPDKEAPHLFKMDLTEKDNDIDTFSFSIDIGNAGYNSLKEFKTKVKIIDTRDNSIRFTGRILKAPENMDSNGFYKDAECESAMAYLLDSTARTQTYLTSDVSSALQDLLNRHNNIVEDDKKIYLGTVNVSGSIAYTCQYETTLSAIVNMLGDIKCHLQVRETNGKLYLDCLKELSDRIIDVRLGMNMKSLVKTIDTTDIGTRIIPLGANNLDISSVNSGLDYIDDLSAKSLYGVIEKPVEYSDITDATELKNKAIADISSYTQPKLTLEIDADDLSFLTGVPADVFKKGLNIHIVNPVMGIDSIFTLVEVDADLTQIYNPKLTISNTPTSIQDIISNMQNTAVNNESVHNGVQVGDSFGIRVVSGDGKFVTTLNATEGISIEDIVGNLKMFFVDIENSTLTMDGIQQLTKDGKVVIINTTNDNGGLFKIFDKDGNINLSAGSESGSADNAGGTLNLYNDDVSKKRVDLGIVKNGDYGVVQVHNSADKVKTGVYGDMPSLFGPGLYVFNDSGGVASYITETGGAINLEPIATRAWVEDYVASHAGGGA